MLLKNQLVSIFDTALGATHCRRFSFIGSDGAHP